MRAQRPETSRASRPFALQWVGLAAGVETAVTSSPGPDVLIRDPLRFGVEVAAELRRRGARVVVALTHQDMAQDTGLAAAADVDVILGGHEHDPLIAEEGKTLITNAGSDARHLVQVDLWLTPQGDLVERPWTFHGVSRRVPPDPRATCRTCRPWPGRRWRRRRTC